MPETSPPYNPENQAALQEKQLFLLLNGLVNNDAKLMTASIVLSDPYHCFTSMELAQEMKNRQGHDVVWTPGNNTLQNYCENSLIPAGIMEKVYVETERNPYVAAYKATEFGSEFGLAFSGALLDWSLKYPDIALQHLFGSTQSSGTIRAPQLRYLVLSELIKEAVSQPSYVEILPAVLKLGIKQSVLNRHLRDLEFLGVVTIQSKLRKYNPSIEILDPNFKEYKVKPMKLSRETKLIYQALEVLFSDDKKNIDLNIFLEECQKLDPSISITNIRRVFLRASHKTSTDQLKDRVRIGYDKLSSKKQSSVELVEGYRPAIIDLISRINDVASDQDLENYRNTARKIIATPNDFSALVRKTVEFSNNIKGQNGGDIIRIREVKELLQSLGALSIREINEELKKGDDSCHVDTVRLALDALLQRGNVSVDFEPIENYRDRKVAKYKLIEER